MLEILDSIYAVSNIVSIIIHGRKELTSQEQYNGRSHLLHDLKLIVSFNERLYSKRTSKDSAMEFNIDGMW